MKAKDKVKYTGKGFIRFDPEKTDMTILEVLAHDLRVDYYGTEMLVYKHEVKEK